MASGQVKMIGRLRDSTFMGKLRKFFDCFQANEGHDDKRAHSGKWLKGHCPRSVCSAQEQGRAKEIVLPSTFILSFDLERNLDLH
jgi:hypothetical protein